MEQLLLVTQRLKIRNLRLSDVNDFVQYRSNEEVVKYQGFDVMSKPLAADFILSQQDKQIGDIGEWVQFGIECSMRHKLIGDCAIKFADDSHAEIGITISHLEQQNGFGSEAMNGILGYLFDVVGLHRIVEITDVKNLASISMLESVGFRREGHFVENVFFKGSWGSEYQYAFLKSEWDLKKS